jgi:ubiquinone/menaquinone biosynthesis C-methylase UbiE
MAEYKPEIYWSEVAEEIKRRGESYIAGDDNPYYRYKRRMFLKKFLDTIDFQDRTVLEVGFGPGGNLKHIATHHRPRKLRGVDVSRKMLEIASKNLSSYDVELENIDGMHIPYEDQSIDTTFTVTVLQHDTDATMFRNIVRDICRVTRTTIVLMEDIGRSTTLGGENNWIGRSVDVYKSIVAEHGFQWVESRFLNTRISRVWQERVSAAYHRVLRKHHEEGEPIGGVLKGLIGLPLPLTAILDRVFVEEQSLAKMTFHRV